MNNKKEVKTIYRFVIKQKYVDLLIGLDLEEANIREISKRVDMNYAYISLVLQQWEKERIINKTMKGRKVNISLTEKGKNIVECLKRLRYVIEFKELNVSNIESKQEV